MSSRRALVVLVLLLAVRALLLGWDSGLLSPHPDERRVAFVAEGLEGWRDDPQFYAYGTLHFQLVRAVTAVAGFGEGWHALLRGGRLLSLLASLGALLLAWGAARRAWGRRTADLVLLLGAAAPLDLQQSHFATVEAHHAFWVVATLVAAWRLGRTGATLAALTAGAVWGASLAVKVSSMPLVAVLAVAIAAVAGRGRVRRATGLAAAVLAAAAAVFWLGQPWAFRNGAPPLPLLAALAGVAAVQLAAERSDVVRRWSWLGAGALAVLALVMIVAAPPLSPAYLAGVAEQMAMVSGEADVVYVRVYRGTLPVVYPALELAAWGLGPFLLGAVLWGCGRAAWRTVRRARRWLAGEAPSLLLLAMLLLWLGPMAVRLATYQVKFLRYWEPLVLPAVMVAAWALARAGRRGAWWRRATLVGTLLWTVMYALAFARPHPHHTAARWLDAVMTPGQTVAVEHWDEELPLAAAGVERRVLTSYDLPDDAAKVGRLAEELAASDWVVLSSHRVRRTVLADPGRFPFTARLYRLLLTGQAGFEVLAIAERGPRLLGLEMPIQRADESFVNYEMPRVLILRRAGPAVAAGDLTGAALRPDADLDRLDWAALERRAGEGVPRLDAPPRVVRQAVDLALWIVVVAGAAAAAWVLLLPLIGAWRDGGLGLAAVTGWFLPAWLLWLGSKLEWWRVGPTTATLVWLALAGAALAVLGWRRQEVAAVWRRRRRGMATVVAVAAGIGALFLVARAVNPAVFWGEKPMDLSFLSAFVRAPSWPPGEPWMAGRPLHYYYLGQTMGAFPILVSGTSAGVGYNLVCATVPALAAAALASLGMALAPRRRRVGAVLLPGLVLLSGNLAWPFLWDLAGAGRWFDLWWATSRVIPGFAIDEYPLWTALFADLHPHFLAQPLLAAVLGWGWAIVRARRRLAPTLALGGLTAGVLAATNPWDVPVAAAALAAFALIAGRRPARAVGRLAVTAAVGAAGVAPYLAELAAWMAAGVAGQEGVLLNRDGFAPAWALARHFGLFAVPLLAAAVGVIGRWLPAVVVPVVAAGLAGATLGTGAAAAAAVSVMFMAAMWIEPGRTARLGWSLAAVAAVLVTACERFTLMDRMNTLFKVYNGVWFLLAAALCLILLTVGLNRRRVLLAVWLPLETVALFNLPLGLAQGWLQPRVHSPRPSLDGRAYLAGHDPQTWYLTRVLNGVARSGEVVAEAAGPSYGAFTRIAMHTGLPTVVGWEWHLRQRGQDPLAIERRRRDLELLYRPGEASARREVLDRYGVRWVVVARLERETYALEAADPLAGVRGVEILAQRAGAILYRVERPHRATMTP